MPQMPIYKGIGTGEVLRKHLTKHLIRHLLFSPNDQSKNGEEYGEMSGEVFAKHLTSRKSFVQRWLKPLW